MLHDHDLSPQAEEWGFDGWVQAGFDIGADGSVKNARALISYPPFIFSDATEKAVSRFRYLPTCDMVIAQARLSKFGSSRLLDGPQYHHSELRW